MLSLRTARLLLLYLIAFGTVELFCGGRLSVVTAAQMEAQEESIPVHELVDRRMQAASGLLLDVCGDAEFLRRISLDLTGIPPLASEARDFLADGSPDKRKTIIDRLMNSPMFDRHLAATLDVMLMERRPNTHVSQDEWLAWLVQSVRDDKPWSVLAREMLSADGDDPQHRATSRFYLDRGSEPHTIARDTGRIFFGRDLQCAQCHDSPLVSDFLQADYQGLLAFTAAGYEVRKKHGEKEVSVLAERAGTDLAFESVFNRGTQHRTGARLPGMKTLDEPFYLPGEEYEVAPADGVRAVPKFSRRDQLARLATDGSNELFNLNIANRLWAHMMGRGLVHPADMIHPDNPATDPQLLEDLAARLAADGFRIRSFLRELALTRVYQRPFDLPTDISEASRLAAARIEPLNARLQVVEVEARRLSDIHEQTTMEALKAESDYVPAGVELDAARNACAEAKKKFDQAAAEMNAAVAKRDVGKSAADTLQTAVRLATEAEQLVPDDAELSAVVVRLRTRSEQVTAELTALQSAVDQKTAVVDASREAWQTSRTAVETLAEKIQPLQDALRAAEVRVVASRARLQKAQLQETSLRYDLASARLASEADRTTAPFEAAVAALRDAENVLAGMTEQQNAISDRMKTQTAAVEKLKEDLSAASLRSADVASQLQQQLRAKNSLAETVASLDRARVLLEGDDSLRQLLAEAAAASVAVNDRIRKAQQRLTVADLDRASADRQHQSAMEALAQIQEEEQQITAAIAAHRIRLKSAEQVLADQQVRRQDAVDRLAASMSDRFQLATLKPLTPEQLCWSIFRVTTVYDRYAAAEVAELDKTAPLSESQLSDPVAIKARAIEVEHRTFEKLKGNVATFVQFYGGGAGQPQGDFYATPDQALFTSNGGSINSWVVPAGNNAAERMLAAADDRSAAEELYLGVLTRMPSEQEIAEVSEFLAARGDRSKAVQELFWGLLNSAEFRFNH